MAREGTWGTGSTGYQSTSSRTRTRGRHRASWEKIRGWQDVSGTASKVVVVVGGVVVGTDRAAAASMQNGRDRRAPSVVRG